MILLLILQESQVSFDFAHDTLGVDDLPCWILGSFIVGFALFLIRRRRDPQPPTWRHIVEDPPDADPP